MKGKRTFDIKLVSSDAFLNMPISAQCLFFHLCIRADDEGFVDRVKSIIKQCGATDEDIEVLKKKRYILTFPESNVIVIKHWKLHNIIDADEFEPTVYAEEKSKLYEKENGAYTFDSRKAEKLSDKLSIGERKTQLDTVKEVISYLNEKCGTKYRYSTLANQRGIVARLNEGNYTVEDFKSVIDKKVADWGENPRMCGYLRPETLFGNKFESYLNQLSSAGKTEFDEWGDCR